ncbi:glycoside hydrolase family 28 protein [Butyrivibrio proteoclasticus]|uniref:glycoside hydrolase family 28 protein n=1 Tax=Butyrivibrio proteoclasticus TaxID=43305 RepID=UPI000558B29C|nr:glycoside hydrolase family 28 protein [Butyrivibrio proteoclasticus]
MKDFNVVDYGAKPDGISKCTDAIQRAIDDCSTEGGRVVFPAGEYLSGSLLLKSNVELHLESGAVLVSSLDEADVVDFSKDFVDDNADTGWEGGCFLYACHARDITISGFGTIDGQGRKVFYDDEPEDSPKECPLNVKGFRPRMSFLEDVENLTIVDVTFKDAAFWTLHMAGCRNVRIENIRIMNHKRGVNTDGIDPDCCKNVIIRGCNIVSGDDCIVLKSTAPMYKKYGDCENIIVNSCVLSTCCSAIKIGTETYGPIHDVIVSDCVLKDCIRGIGIWSRDGGEIYNITMHHISGNTRNFADSVLKKAAIYSWWGEGEPVFISAVKRENVDRIPGKVHHVSIDHLMLKSEAPIVVAGEEYSPISDVKITDSVIRMENQSGKTAMVLDERPSVNGRREMKMPVVYNRGSKDVFVEADIQIGDSIRELFSSMDI